MLKAPSGIFTEDPSYSFQAQRERLIKQGNEEGVDGLNDSPAEVKEAAKAVGKGIEFKWTISCCPNSLIRPHFGS
jgi:hypothetical protein